MITHSDDNNKSLQIKNSPRILDEASANGTDHHSSADEDAACDSLNNLFLRQVFA